MLDTSLPANVVRVPAGHATTSTLGAMFGAIRVEKPECREGIHMIDALYTAGAGALGGAWPVVWSLIKIVALLLPCWVAWLT